jgi:molybdate transport system substrate-binding protein
MLRLHPAIIVFLISAGIFTGLVLLLIQESDSNRIEVSKEPLMVHCAAGLRVPVEAIAKQYEEETGQRIVLHFGGSQTLQANIELTHQGDLYLPADEEYIAMAQKKNLIDEVIPLVGMRGILLVRPEEERIRSFTDLLKPEIKLAQANPDAAAIGKLTRDHLTKKQLWTPLEKKTTVFKGTVNDVANAVQLSTVDAGIVWDAVAFQYPKLKVVQLPEFQGIVAKIKLGVLKTSKFPTQTLEFARYIAAEEKGLVHFAKNGFTLTNTGDRGSNPKEILLYAGSMLRPAIEETIMDFERREGVKVTRVYNGCGILVSQMKTGEKPDLYFACDTSFMNDVREQFETPSIVSSNQLVIATPKGNPKQILSLKDLGKPDLKVGVGHEQQCALGAISKETFIQTGLYAAIRKNVVVESPTGDFLINQLRTGSLDAVVAYRSNALPYEKDLDAIPVTGIPCAAPNQPIAINKSSEKKHLTERLIQAIQSSESKDRFEKLGFGWQVKK